MWAAARFRKGSLSFAVQFALDYFLIIRALPDPIRGLLNASWLETCDADLEIGNTGIPCVENMVLVVRFPMLYILARIELPVDARRCRC